MWPLVALLGPVVVGVVAAAAWRRSARTAIGWLNLYPTWVAFPALIAGGVARVSSDELDGRGLGVLALALAFTLPVARAFGRPIAGPAALVASFGNVAYVGLPALALFVGPAGAGLAAVGIVVHMALGILVGPYLLARWGSEIARPIPWSRLVLQPLVVAPLVGLALRWLPSPVFAVLDLVLAPVGASAPPVALAVLGMYLFTERRRVLGIDAADGVPIFAKLVVVPAATLAWGWALGIGGDRLVTWVVLAAVPAGITTFSLARDLGVAEDRVARAILTTSALAVVTMPGWAMLARAVGSMP